MVSQRKNVTIRYGNIKVKYLHVFGVWNIFNEDKIDIIHETSLISGAAFEGIA